MKTVTVSKIALHQSILCVFSEEDPYTSIHLTDLNIYGYKQLDCILECMMTCSDETTLHTTTYNDLVGGNISHNILDTMTWCDGYVVTY